MLAGMWVGEARKCGNKIKISKMKPTLEGCGRECFEGNGPTREYVVGEPIFYRSVETGQAHIVQIRRQGAGRGPIEKFDPPPRPNLGADPRFLNFVLRVYRGPTNPENLAKKLGPFPRYKFFKFWRKIPFSGVRGNMTSRKFQRRCVLVRSRCVPTAKFGPNRLN